MSTNAFISRIAGAVLGLVAASTAVSAAPAASTMPASAATAEPAASAIAAVYLNQAPTLRALSELATRERMKQANERYSKLFETQQPAQTKQPAKLDAKPDAMLFEPPPVYRRVQAVFGPVGREKAEIERGDGVVVAVEQGGLVDGFRVLAVKPGLVDVQQVRAECARKAAAEERRQAPQRRKDVKPCGPAPVQRISVGGVFR